jgi:hypothetical protein
MLLQSLPEAAKGMLLRFSRSEIAPDAYFVQRQAPNGNLSRRVPVRHSYGFELANLGVPADRIKYIQEQLSELIPGTFFDYWVLIPD